MQQREPTPEERALKEALLRRAILGALETREGVLMFGPLRSIIFTQVTYSVLLRAIHEYAPHVVKYIFYDLGYERGEQLVDMVKQWSPDPEEQCRLFAEAMTEMGYGDIKVTSLDLSKPEATLRARNTFESGLVRLAGIYRSPRTVDHFIRGLWAGFMTAFTGREMVCEEMACEFRGDEACEFVILPSEG